FPDDHELRAVARVAVVDQRFAARAWPSAAAVGARVQVGDVFHDVVGVVASPRYSLIRETPPVIFVPAPPVDERASVTVFAPRLSADDLQRRFDVVMSHAAPGLSANVREQTFERQFDDELANARFQEPIIVVLGLFAFTVAGVGLFGVIAYLVEQRTRDFGIRLALGARAGDIRRALLGESLWPAGIGLSLGLGAAWALQGVMRATMFGWESSGPLAAIAVGGLVIGVACLAVAGPARRVLRIDPSITLRSE
ncbi:MAG TPA: FtsX-like permease family protein, partial [Vicinamibacterales bacterium]|nr:FtsX-like permease family protein [Vicinamibacterales bacterium]